MQRPFILPYAYSITILLFTIVTTAVFILLLLLLFCYYHYYKTVATDKLLRASLFPGAAELTTHLLTLINILWLPLCRINKFGFYFPQKLFRSPILVGHQWSSVRRCSSWLQGDADVRVASGTAHPRSEPFGPNLGWGGSAVLHDGGAPSGGGGAMRFTSGGGAHLASCSG
jgi:hypothetical protein